MTPDEPRVAPFHSCIRCYRGDTATGFAVMGEAEFVIVALHKLVGLSLDEARTTFAHLAEHEFGCRSGNVPSGQLPVIVRLCRDCAHQIGAVVDDIRRDELPGIRQRDDEPESDA